MKMFRATWRAVAIEAQRLAQDGHGLIDAKHAVDTLKAMRRIMKNRNTPCVVCSKPTASVLRVNYDNQTGQIVAPDFVGPESGLQPIGSNCAKKIPQGWVIR